MTSVRTPSVALLVAAALVAAGCGSSSKTTATKSGSAPTPAPPTSPGTSTTSGGIDCNKVPASTPIASPDYRNCVLQGGLQSGLSQSAASAFADCLVTGFERAGAKTQGDLKNIPKQKLAAVATPCAQQAQSR